MKKPLRIIKLSVTKALTFASIYALISLDKSSPLSMMDLLERFLECPPNKHALLTLPGFIISIGITC
jgi:hypothetical protein